MPTKVHLVKAVVFPVVMYGCKSWTVKKAECWRINAFELWCWRRLLRVPWTARRSNQSILKEISSGCAFSSVAQSCPTLCDPVNRSTPGLPVHHQLLEFTQTHAHRVSDAIQPSHPLSPPSPPACNPSQHQGLFQWVNSSHEVAKVLEFQLQHQSFQWTLISFRIDWLDLLAVQETLKSLLQHHSSRASIFRHSAFFTVQLSHPYMTTGKTIASLEGLKLKLILLSSPDN